MILEIQNQVILFLLSQKHSIPFPSEFRRNECQFRLNKIENRQRATQLCQKENQFLHERILFPP